METNHSEESIKAGKMIDNLLKPEKVFAEEIKKGLHDICKKHILNFIQANPHNH